MKGFYCLFCIFFVWGYLFSTTDPNEWPESKGQTILYITSATAGSPVLMPFIVGMELGNYRERLDSLESVQPMIQKDTIVNTLINY